MIHGNVTGRHLHLECSTTASWQCDTFINPCTNLGIPNEDDLVLEWGGTPPPPILHQIKNKWKRIFYKHYKIIK